MKIFALADPHLSLSSDKPMAVFGDNWNNHDQKIRDRWSAVVSDDDVVIVAGDISWALKISEAEKDIAFIRELPGKKILVKGNHDYWWAGLKKVRELTGDGFEIIQNNSVIIGGVGFCGSRLWNYPFVKWPFSTENAAEEEKEPVVSGQGQEKKHNDVDDEKVCRSELGRLENSMKSLPQGLDLRICVTHFPPVSATPQSNQLTGMMEKYCIDYAVYGHLHALDRTRAYPAADCVVDGISFILSSSDWLDFTPKLIVEV